MIRCTIELLPYGQEDSKKVIGLIEIANDATGTQEFGNYYVVMKKGPDYSPTLKQDFRASWPVAEYNDRVISKVAGHWRVESVYHLLSKALRACGIKT